jgi:hypothetical protein
MKQPQKMLWTGIAPVPCPSTGDLGASPMPTLIPVDQTISRKAERMLGMVPASGKQKLIRAVAAFERRAETSDAQSGAVAAVISQFSSLGSMDVSEAVFLVLMMATQDMDDDIRMIMAEISAMQAAKQKLRDLIRDLNDWISKEMSQGKSSSDINNATTSSGPQVRRVEGAPLTRTISASLTTPHFRVPYPRAPVIRFRDCRQLSPPELQKEGDELNAQLDSVNETSAMTSLRKQMMMDRRSKFIQTLSSIMRKISTTQESLVQNLK